MNFTFIAEVIPCYYLACRAVTKMKAAFWGNFAIIADYL